MKRLDLLTIDRAMRLNWSEAREYLNAEGVKPTTVVTAGLFEDALELSKHLRNPSDLGANGKMTEVALRIAKWLESGRSYAYWSEFSARAQGKDDMGNGTRTEVKSGAGNWLYSYKSDTLDAMLDEYREKVTLIHWVTPYFDITCTWSELLEYLEGYNDKGLTTWFKSRIAYNPESRKYVADLQCWTSSKKKIAFLQECPYNG